MTPVQRAYAAMAAGLLTLAELTLATLGKVRPLKAAYTPGPNLVFADLTLADFDGSNGIAQVVAPDVYTDPGTGDVLVVLHEPAGGWQWHTTGVTNLPQDVHGYALLNAAQSDVLAVTTPLVDPVTLSATGQVIDAGDLMFRIPLGSVN